MLRLSDIKKDYKIASGAVHALKGVSLVFRKSEFVCILGPSGCGKTTLLNIIGGLDHYTAGDLVIQGKSTKDFKDRDWDVYRNHRIGFVFQSYNLIPHQTVLGNVELALTIAGVGKEERKKRAAEALERVGLGAELDKKPNQLSGGQMQRVAIARALVNDPDILLADEPTGALDSKTSVQIMDLMQEIAAERLVIMVTHNPELAEKYATRIVRLHDGLVESDSAPYTAEEEEAEGAQALLSQPTEGAAAATEAAEPEAAAQQPAAQQPAKKKKEKKPRAKMGFLTSLSLSARNLLTKKGRTAITSIAGSIGIISVCLVLALSSGFNSYIERTEEDMLSYYPLEISETSFDMTSIMAAMSTKTEMPDVKEFGDRIYVDSFLTGLAKGITVQNDISDRYVNYIEAGREAHPEWFSAIQYKIGLGLSDNLFTSVEVGGAPTANPTSTTRHYSLSQLKSFYITELETYAPKYSNLVPFASFFGNIVNKMPGTDDYASEDYAKFVLSQYDVLAGEFPVDAPAAGEADGAVLVIGNENNEASDLVLAQLGLLPEDQFLSLFEIGKAQNEEEEAGKDGAQSGEEDYLTIPFEKVIGKRYTFYNNDEIYTPNAEYVDYAPNAYPYEYDGEKTPAEWDAFTDDQGVNIEVKAILRLKEGYTYGCLTEGLNITEATVEKFVAQQKDTEIVQFINEHTIEREFEGETFSFRLISPAKNLDSYYTSVLYYDVTTGQPVQTADGGTMVISIHYSATDEPLRYVGGVDTPNDILIYPTDFDAKEKVLDYLDDWNNTCETENREGEKIKYTDRVGLLMGMVQTMLDVITYVLVAFTAISLVVSSVMIGIITYVSVVERVKEIGVLRSLGASKLDIKNLFNAETFIIGLAAGLFGVAVTYVLSFIVSLIIEVFTGIANIAMLQPLTAFIMVCVSVALTLISGLIPAAAAAKKDPVIALRTE